MTKWPKEWVDPLLCYLRQTGETSLTEQVQTILCVLKDVGALKDPPVPKEYWIPIDIHGVPWGTPLTAPRLGAAPLGGRLLHVIEVTEERVV